MGCGSSATPSVADDQPGTNGKAGRVPAARSRVPAPAAAVKDDDDIPTEVLPESEPPAPIKPPLAFEILLDSDKEDLDGLVKKHPPRPPPRLQRLHPSEAPPSLEELQEKMESAEKRRLQILQSRIASATKANRQPPRIHMEKEEEEKEKEDQMDGENNDSQHMKSVTELKNTINLEGHGLTL